MLDQIACTTPAPPMPHAPVPAAADGTRRIPLAQRMFSYIEHNLCEPDLDGETLQTAFHVSRATLYRLFQDLGGVAHYIRERRLCWAYDYLRQHPDCSITWLLYEAGFGSERQFQRAFQARFDMSPTCWRRLCRAHAPVAPLRRLHPALAGA